MANEQSSLEAVLETDLRELAEEIKNQRERPELQNAAERELIKEAIRAFPSAENNRRSALVSPSDSSAASKSPLPVYAQDAPAEVKLEIEYLLDIALKKGLVPAIQEAQKAPYFVEDAFRDALAGRLYPELKSRGLLKE